MTSTFTGLSKDIIKKYKEDNQLQGSQKINKRHSIKSKSQENQSKFSLNENEIENIFDVIEVETGL